MFSTLLLETLRKYKSALDISFLLILNPDHSNSQKVQIHIQTTQTYITSNSLEIMVKAVGIDLGKCGYARMF